MTEKQERRLADILLGMVRSYNENVRKHLFATASRVWHDICLISDVLNILDEDFVPSRGKDQLYEYLEINGARYDA